MGACRISQKGTQKNNKEESKEERRFFHTYRFRMQDLRKGILQP